MFKGIKFRTRETEPKPLSLDLDAYADLNYAAAAALRAKLAGNEAGYRALKSKVSNALLGRSRENAVRREPQSCEWCQMNGQSLVDLRGNFYISLPQCQPLTPGHCLIVPVAHVLAVTELEEDEYRELRALQRDLRRAYREKLGCHAMFIENAIDLEVCKHMVIHCFPLNEEANSNAPLFFRKEFSEAGYEWAQNRKLIDTHTKGLQASIPKAFPYVHVDFDGDGGFAHIIESRRHYRTLLALEVARDLLGSDPLALSRRLSAEAAKQEVEALVKLLLL